MVNQTGSEALSKAKELSFGLYPHQVEGVTFLLGRQRSVLADEMGLGKTRQSVIAMTAAKPRGPYLVVCPASVKHNWAREIHLVLPEADARVVGPAAPPDVDFTGWAIVNYDLLGKFQAELDRHAFQGVVFDEAHYIKNHRAKRSILSRRLIDNLTTDPVIHVLTGTPLTNRPRDLFPLLQLVQHALGRSFLAFAKRYCDGHRNEFGYWQTGGASNTDELAIQLQGIMLRRKKEQVLDLPPKQRTWIDVEVPESVQNEINAVAAFHLADENRNERGNRNIGRISRARRKLAVAKVPQTIDYVTGAIDQGQKVVLFSHSRHAIRRLEKKFTEGTVCVTGDVAAKRRMALVDRFQEDESVRLFIGQIHAAGIGINLTAANLVVFNDLDWVPANHWQAEDRAHRIGQSGSVNVAYMVAQGTLEEFVRSVLERKAMLIDDLIEGSAISDEMDSDILEELRRVLAHLGTRLERMNEDEEPDTVRQLLRQATDSYLAENQEIMSASVKKRIAPVSESAIEALAAVLTGPARVVYSTPSSSGRSVYRIEVEGGDVSCDCKGFNYRGMCRHVRDLKQALASDGPVPDDYTLMV